MKKSLTFKWIITLLYCIVMQSTAYQQSVSTASPEIENVQINLEDVVGRYNFDVSSGVTTLSVCNLELGKEYGFFIRPDEVCNFSADWSGSKISVWEGSYGADYHYAETVFTAEKACQDIKIYTDCPQGMRITAAQRKSKKKHALSKSLASIQIDQQLSTSELIEEVFIGGGCFEVNNISPIGHSDGRGRFTQGTDAFDIEEGVILSSGNVFNAIGPNESIGVTTDLPGLGEDIDLSILATGVVRDATGIEFDFIPSNDTIRFDYVFASDEYCEFVFADVNDAFGFFISGPGFNGPFSNNGENIALIPGTNNNVSIDDVNDFVNTNFFISNSTSCLSAPQAPNDTEYDGFTTVMTAIAVVQPCETYHIRLVVSDVGDSILDSAVLLGANSFDSGGLAEAIAVGTNGGSTVSEGCEDGQFIFTRSDDDLSEDLVVNFTLSPSSTATSTEDYASLPTSITIPAGQLSFTLFVDVFADLILEGQESIILDLDIPCLCSNPTVELFIEDIEPLELDMENQIICGMSASLSPGVSGGVPNYSFDWSNGEQTPSISITTLGTNTFEVTVTDDCGSQEVVSAEVTLSEEPSASLTGATEICAEGDSGPIDIEINFTGTAPWDIIFSIDGVNQPVVTTSDNPHIIQSADPSTFELVSVTYANGDCPGTVNGEVIITEIEVIPTLTPTPIGCNGDGDGEISVSVSGGTPNYSFNWNDPLLNGDNPGSLPVGTYDVTVIDDNGCEGHASTEITEPPLFVANVDEVTEVDCNNPEGAININVSGGTPNYNFNWSGGATGQSPSGLDPGVYDVTVSDDEGCEVILQAEVIENLDLPDAVALADGIITCTDESIAVDGTGSSVGSEFSYNWIGPGIVSGATTLTPDVNIAGSYTLTVTNNDTGCEEDITVNVEEDIVLPDVMAIAGEIDCNDETIFVDGTGTEVGTDITYIWTTTDGNILNGETTLNPEVDAAGTYTLTVLNGDNGCENEIDVAIIQNNTLPEAVANAPEITCASVEISVDGTGSATGTDITYSWTTPNGNIVSGSDMINPTVDEPGIYIITVVNELTGCENTDEVTVIENNTLPDAVANFTGQIDCITEEITVDGLGSSIGTDINYNWTGPGISSGGNTLNPIVDVGGTYVLTVTNADNGCEATVEVTIPENMDTPDAVAQGGEITCTESNIFIDGFGSSTGGNITYIWSTTDGNILSGDDTLNPMVDEAGTYSLTVTNTTSGCEDMVDVTITEDIDIPEAIANAPQINCANPTISIDGNGSGTGTDISYVWTTIDGNIITGETTLNPTVDEPGTYILVVANSANGCDNTVSVTVDENTTIPDAVADAQGILDCLTELVEIHGVGSSTGNEFDYTWTGPGIVSGGNSLFPEVDEAGTYTLTVLNTDTGCEEMVSVDVEEDQDNPVATIADAGMIDCTTSTLSLNGVGSSIGPDFNLLWETTDGNIISGINSLNPIINEGGTYTLTVTNVNNGCEDEAIIIIDEDTTNPVVVNPQLNPIDCNNPTINLNAIISNAGSNPTIEWTGPGIVSGNGTATPTVNQIGTYTITVTNPANGCDLTSSLTVADNLAEPEADAGPMQALGCNSTVVELDGTSSTSGANIGFEWTTLDGNISSNINSLNPIVNQPGTYTLTITDLTNGCDAVSTVEVTQDNIPPIAIVSNPGDIDCINTELTVSAIGSTEGPEFVYEWVATVGNIVEGDESLEIVVDQPGTYTFYVYNTVNWCDDSYTIFVDDNSTDLEAEAGNASTITCDESEVMLSGSTPETGNVEYAWTSPSGNILSGANTLNPIVNEAGTYVLTVTNLDNGCVGTDETTVTANADVPEADAGPNGLISCLVDEITLDGTNSSIGGDVTYTWNTVDGNIISGANSLTPTVDASGTYELIVTNNLSQCVAISTAIVTIDTNNPDIAFEPVSGVDCENPIVSIDASNSSNGSDYQYTWTTTDGNIVEGAETPEVDVDEAGTYILTVTNTLSGCEHTDQITIDANVNTPTVLIAEPNMITCQEEEVVLNAMGSSSGSEYQMTWTTDGGNFVMNETTLMPTVNAAGTYTLTILNTDSNCEETQTITVEADAAIPEADAGQGITLDCINTSTVLSGGISGGVNLDFVWSTNDGAFLTDQATLTPEVNAGTYILTVLNTDNNCTAVSSVTIENDAAVPEALIANPDNIDCLNTSVQIDASASSDGNSISYAWTTIDGSIVFGEDTDSPIVDGAGTYTLTVTNADNNCTDTQDIEVMVNAETPDAAVEDPVMITCQNSEITLDGSDSQVTNNATIEWSTSGGNFLQDQNTLNPIVNAAGEYTLTIYDTLSLCFSQIEITVEADANIPTAMIDPAQDLTCLLDTLVLNALVMNGTNFEYEWTTTGGMILDGANTLNPTIEGTGTYAINILNLDNDCETNASIVVEANTVLPDAIIAQPDTLSCTTEDLFIDAIASSSGSEFSYAWSTLNGTIVSGEMTNNPVVSDPGEYSLTITNETTGCAIEETVEVFQNADVPLAICEPDFTIGCDFNQLELNAQGSTVGADVNYFWTSNDDNIVGDNTVLNPTIDGPGIFTLTVTNVLSGCQDSDEVIVVENVDEPAFISNQAPELTCDVQEVTIVLDVAGNTDDFVYEWTTDDGNIVAGPDGLTPLVDAAGTYQILVTDTTNMCFNLSQITIEEDENIPDAMAVAMGELTCTIDEVTLNGAGSSTGTGYTFEWTTIDGTIVSGGASLNPTVSEAGLYTLSVYDDDNCVNTASVNVEIDNQQPNVDPGSPGALTCAVATTMLDASNSSTTGDFDYTWTTANGTIDSGANGLTPTVSTAGTYLLTILNNENGCAHSESVEVVENFNLPIINLNDPAELNCNIETADLLANIDTDDEAYTFIWTALSGNISNGGMTLEPEVNMPGVYEIEVFNTENQCITTETVTVSQNIATPDAQASANDELNCELESLQLSGTGTSIGANFDYTWTTSDGNIQNGASTLNPTIDEPGTYQILVTNTDNFCTSLATVTVTESADVPDAIVAEPNDLDCNIDQIELNANGSSQGATFEYNWSTPNGNIVSGETTLQPSIDEPGQYVLTVIDNSNGCDETYEVTVEEDVLAPAADAGMDVELPCMDFEIVTLDASNSSQGANITYDWSTQNGDILTGIDTQFPEVGSSGIYTVLITNTNNGCTNEDEVEVRQNEPIEADALGQNPACEIANGSILINNVTGGVAPIIYSIDGGQNFQSSNEFNGLPGGIYDIVVEDSNGCLDELAVTLNAPSPVNVQVSADAIIQLGDEIQLSANTNLPVGQIQVVWTPSEGLSCANCLNPIAAPLTDTEYTVTVISDDGCLDVATVRLSVEEVGGVYVPNGFSPDYDGINDIFYIQAKPGYVEKVNSFLVYSRWGETVYQYYDFDPNNPAFGWDGKHKGEPMNPAVFGWWAEITLANGETIIVEGDVTLVR